MNHVQGKFVSHYKVTCFEEVYVAVIICMLYFIKYILHFIIVSDFLK